MSTPFCAICLSPARDAGDLQRSVEDDRLECRRCRNEHPRAGGYSFKSAAGDDATADRRVRVGRKEGSS